MRRYQRLTVLTLCEGRQRPDNAPEIVGRQTVLRLLDGDEREHSGTQLVDVKCFGQLAVQDLAADVVHGEYQRDVE